MKKEKSRKKRNHEKRIIYCVFISTIAVFILVAAGFVLRLVNVEKNNPVLINSDFEFVTYEGKKFVKTDTVPDELECTHMEWLGGARIDGKDRINQAFRDRYSYATYVAGDGSEYIWVKDGDFYKEGFEWADWRTDYKHYKSFINSYFYKAN